MNEKLGIAGSGTIACGLAAVASASTDVILWARSPESANRAQISVDKSCGRLAEQGPTPPGCSSSPTSTS